MFENESIRLQMLNKLGDRLNDTLVLPHFTFSYKKIYEAFDNTEESYKVISNMLLEGTKSFKTNMIFSHPCPIDEFAHRNFSFAGVYESYQPYSVDDNKTNLQNAVKRMLNNGLSEYASYYYHRNGILGQKKISIMVSPELENIYLFGNGYAMNGKYLFQFYDSPLSIYHNDSKKYLMMLGGSKDLILSTIINMLYDIEKYFNMPIDVEFMMNRFGQLFISEVRPISLIHVKNWNNIDESIWDKYKNNSINSTIIGTVGEITGEVVDLRDRKPNKSDFVMHAKKIYLISYKSIVGTGIIEFLKFIDRINLFGFNIIVFYDKHIIDNHIHYVAYEDIGIKFICKTNKKIKVVEGKNITVVSDGFKTEFLI